MGAAAKPHLAVVFLMILFLGASLALPATDVMESVYDESEALPYESVPLFAGDTVLLNEPVILQSTPEFGLQFRSRLLDGRDEIRAESSGKPLQLLSDSLTILDHCLRC